MIAHREGSFAPAVSAERARLRAAAMELVVERGIEGAGAELIAARAGLEPQAFHRHFADARECCLAVYLANIDEFDRIVFAAVEREEGWRERLRASAYAALRYVRDRPLEARFNLIGALGLGELAQAHRDRYVGRIVDLIDAGREDPAAPPGLSRETAERAFGAVYEFLVREAHEGGVDRVDRFVPELMYIAVRPYVGEAAARQELAIPAPPDPAKEGG